MTEVVDSALVRNDFISFIHTLLDSSVRSFNLVFLGIWSFLFGHAALKWEDQTVMTAPHSTRNPDNSI